MAHVGGVVASDSERVSHSGGGPDRSSPRSDRSAPTGRPSVRRGAGSRNPRPTGEPSRPDRNSVRRGGPAADKAPRLAHRLPRHEPIEIVATVGTCPPGFERGDVPLPDPRAGRAGLGNVSDTLGLQALGLVWVARSRSCVHGSEMPLLAPGWLVPRLLSTPSPVLKQAWSEVPRDLTPLFQGLQRRGRRAGCRLEVGDSPNSFVSARTLIHRVRATVNPVSMLESRLFQD